ncbi:MAG: hypothetical protein O3A46_07855, partial [Candidatus Poribacteria bacterium]|nr:hypothetical protein [Candidatus Poribacteria bacterium]
MRQPIIPDRLAETCRHAPETREWLDNLSGVIDTLAERWELSIDHPFVAEASCSWVAPCARRDGSRAVVKIGMPHMEARDEVHALRFWSGEGAVLMLDADESLNAMLLERCEPGTALRDVSEPEQDRVIAGLLRRLWRVPTQPHPFRHLSEMTAHWRNDALEFSDRWTDAGLTREGLRLFRELHDSAPKNILLATDLHAGNVLRSQREPWLVIDPKPFIGDPAYDATQHLLDCDERLRSDPLGTIRRFADLLEVDDERVRLWLFARVAVESCCDIHEPSSMARRII